MYLESVFEREMHAELAGHPLTANKFPIASCRFIVHLASHVSVETFSRSRDSHITSFCSNHHQRVKNRRAVQI
jgi:hypothetical protein